jgi:glutathione S-transferase
LIRDILDALEAQLIKSTFLASNHHATIADAAVFAALFNTTTQVSVRVHSNSPIIPKHHIFFSSFCDVAVVQVRKVPFRR